MTQAVDRAYAALRSQILSNELGAGQRLGEIDLAASLGLSRTPVREALRRLGAQGLVELLPNRGARVATWTRKDVDDIFELRTLLESHAAMRAATSIPDEDIDHLAGLCAGMDTAGAPGPDQDLYRVAELNGEFHQGILRAAGNQRLAEVMRGLVELPMVLRTFHRYSADALARSLGHHTEIVAALRARDPWWAEAVMRSHVRAGHHVLASSLPDRGEQA